MSARPCGGGPSGAGRRKVDARSLLRLAVLGRSSAGVGPQHTAIQKIHPARDVSATRRCYWVERAADDRCYVTNLVLSRNKKPAMMIDLIANALHITERDRRNRPFRR